MTVPTLHSKRLTLRPHQASDIEPWTAFCTSQAAQGIGGPLAPQRAWTFLAEAVAQWHLFGYGSFAVELADGTFAGQISLSKPPAYKELELGWILFPEFQGVGYASEGAETVRDFAFQALKVPGLVSYISPTNTASLKVAKRLGAVYDPDAALPDWKPCAVYRHPHPGAAT